MAFKNSTEDNGETVTGYDPSIVVPVGAVEGDTMFAVMVTTDVAVATSITPPAGWALEESASMPITGAGASSDPGAWIYSKSVSAADEAGAGTDTYQWVFNGNVYQAGTILLYAGNVVWGEYAESIPTGTGTSRTAPSVTTTTTDEIVLHSFLKDGGSPASITDPAGTSRILQGISFTGAAGGTISAVEETYPTAGATGSKTFTYGVNEALAFTFSLQSLDPDPDITINDYGTPAASQVFQRSPSGDHIITVTGDYNNGTPTNIEARVVFESSGLPVSGLDWATLEASPTGGSYSGAITVPEGGYYLVETRWSNDTAKEISQLQGFGVGILCMMYGQSNMQRMSTVTSSPAAAHALTSYYNGGWIVVPAANGVRELLNGIATLTGLPCAAVNSAVGGLSIDELNNGTASWTAMAAELTAIGGDVEHVLWHQGEADGQDGTAQAAYVSDFRDVFTAYQALTSRSNTELNMLVVLLGNSNGYLNYTDEKLETIRDAHRQLEGDTGIYISHSTADQPLDDTIHMTAAGFAESGKRFAQTIAFLNGDETFTGRGPAMTAVETSGSDVIVTITHDGGSTLSGIGAGLLDTFEVSDDDFSTLLTITSTTIDTGTQVTLGLSSTPSTQVKVRYNWGMDLDIDNVLVDNTSLALPLFAETIAEPAPGAYELIVESGTYAVSGQSTGLTAQRVLIGNTGSYAQSGQDANLLANRTLSLSQGSYALTGQDVILDSGLADYTLVMNQGSYLLSGQNSTLLASRALSLDQGGYSLSGQSIGITANRLVSLSTGFYALDGQDVGITKISAYELVAESGSYGLSGQSANLVSGRNIVLNQGDYSITGNTVSLDYTQIITGANFSASVSISSFAGAEVNIGSVANIDISN